MATRSSPRTHLSKSRIMTGIQCEKALWLDAHRRDLRATPSPGQERAFRSGTEVGELARTRFSGGALVRAPYWDLQASLSETAALLARPEIDSIFEAAFQAHNTHVKIDILARDTDGAFRIIEVKSSTSVKPVYLTDTAIQWYVCEKAGVPISGCALMHLNRECTSPDLSNLFEIEDITEQCAEMLPRIPELIDSLTNVISGSTEPVVEIGTHCEKPYECQFRPYCWQQVPERSIFTIPRLSGPLTDSFVSRGILSLEDVPLEELGESQTEYVTMSLSGQSRVDEAAIREELARLEFPLYFLDFETCADAVPRFDGLHPWGQYPFQFSLHVLDDNGDLAHREYLHDTASDPRGPLAEALCSAVGRTGTLVAYNASFEQRVISALADHLEQYPMARPGDAADPADCVRALREMPPRFFDLLTIFRNHYSHPGFLGSNSIKNVLPVVVPELSYSGMEVANGDEAQAVWSALVTDNPHAESRDGAADTQGSFGFEREATLDALREYCRLDTLAMVRIYEVLKKL